MEGRREGKKGRKKYQKSLADNEKVCFLDNTIEIRSGLEFNRV